MSATVPVMFDKEKLFAQKRRALKQSAKHRFLFETAAEMLCEHLDCIQRQHDKALNLFAANDVLGKMLCGRNDIKNLTTTSFLPSALLADNTAVTVTPETPFPFERKSIDLIVSSMGLHWIEDVPGYLHAMRELLKPDGLLLVNMLGAGTLHELRESLAEADHRHYGGMAARLIPFTEVKTLGSLLQRAGLEMPITDSETITVHYPDLITLMRDLRLMGEGNALLKRSKKPVSRSWLATAEDYYRTHFSDGEGGIVARFELLTATGLAPKTPA